jgi:hypothetical protein
MQQLALVSVSCQHERGLHFALPTCHPVFLSSTAPPNPSLERTSTGMALGPRADSEHCSVSRAKRHAGGVRSAQTLGITGTHVLGTP